MLPGKYKYEGDMNEALENLLVQNTRLARRLKGLVSISEAMGGHIYDKTAIEKLVAGKPLGGKAELSMRF